MVGRVAVIIALLIVRSVMFVEASATTILVPSEQPTIQAGIDAAGSGDTVLVAPGAYVENIVIDHEVVVQSEAGPATAIIDGSSPADPDLASVVRISAGSIEGFDIRNGTGTLLPGLLRAGGGVLVEDGEAPGPLIRDNWVHDNLLTQASVEGGGIFTDTPVRVISNRIFSNVIERTGSGWLRGAAISAGLYGSGVLLQDNEVFDNEVVILPGDAGHGAIFAGEATVTGNVIACNVGGWGSAIWGRGHIENNTIVANLSNTVEPAVSISHAPNLLVILRGNSITHSLGPGLRCDQRDLPPFTTFVVECNNIWANFPGGQVTGDCGEVIGQDGNISVDPDFAEAGCPWVPGSGCLNEGSPLLPENSPPGCGLIGAMGLCPPIGVEEPEPSSPSRFQALPARPNPFAERTTIPFYLAEGAAVEVWIYNVLGRRLRTLSPGWLFAGEHTQEWDGRDDDGARAASGAYVARIRAGGQELTRTLLLIR